MAFFRKPTAVAESRSIRLDGQEVGYRLKRSPRRRTVGLRIDRHGVTVSAPLKTSLNYLEDLLRQRAGWLLAKLDEWRAKQQAPLTWQHGAKLLFLGSEVALALKAGGARLAPVLEDDSLHVAVPDPADEAAVQRKVEQWYRRQAKLHFQQRIGHYAPRMELKIARLALSSARTRWGSCNSRGEIRLNWRLIQAPISQIDYVVVHELAHLAELNHSPRFWAIVERHLPQYRDAHSALRRHGERYHRL